MPGSAAVHQRQRYAQYIGPPLGLVTVTGSQSISDAMVAGARYAVRCAETAIYLRQGGAGLVVTASDFLLRQGDLFFVNADDVTNNRLAVLTASGLGGNLRITRVDSLGGGALGSPALQQSMYFAQYIGATISVVVDGGGHTSAPLIDFADGGLAGRFLLLCPDDDCYLRQGGDGVTAATTDFLLPAGEPYELNVDDVTSYRVAALSATGIGGTLNITRLDTV